MKALILAGSQEDSPLTKFSRNKALLKICGKEMIKYIIDAMRELDFIDTIAVVGPKDELVSLEGFADIIIDSGSSMTENVLKGAEVFPDSELILIATSDIPMITSEAIRDFVEKAQKVDADFYYPIVRKEINEKKYPGVKRTYVKIKDGTFTGGNIVLVKVDTVKRCIKQAEEFMIYRKKPLKLAQILGPVIIIKFLMGTITISELEKRVGKLFGIKAKGIISDYPEIGRDVDKESDVEIAEKVLCGGIANEAQ